MPEVVRKQVAVGEKIYLLCPLMAKTVTRIRPTFPVQLVISPRYMQLTLASCARTVTSWVTCTNTARRGQIQVNPCKHHCGLQVPSQRLTSDGHGRTHIARLT